MKRILKLNQYTISVRRCDTGDNYNQFATVYYGKSMMFGTVFKNTATNKEIKDWAKSRILKVTAFEISKGRRVVISKPDITEWQAKAIKENTDRNPYFKDVQIETL